MADPGNPNRQDTCWSSTGRPCDDGPDPQPTESPGPTPSMCLGPRLEVSPR